MSDLNKMARHSRAIEDRRRAARVLAAAEQAADSEMMTEDAKRAATSILQPPSAKPIEAIHGLGADYMAAHSALFNHLEHVRATRGPEEADTLVHELARREFDKTISPVYGKNIGEHAAVTEFAAKSLAKGYTIEQIKEQAAHAVTEQMGLAAEMPAELVKNYFDVGAGPDALRDMEHYSTTIASGHVLASQIMARTEEKAGRRLGGLLMGKMAHDDRPNFVTTISDERPRTAARDIMAAFASAPPYTLQRPAGSAFHHLRQAFHDLAVLLPALDCSIPLDHAKSFDCDHTIFVVEHDWLAVFAQAKDADGGVRMPSEFSAFEMRVNNKRLIACFAQNIHANDDVAMMLFIETCEGWAMAGTADISPDGMIREAHAGKALVETMSSLVLYVWGQVRALLISVEAAIMVREVRKPDPGLVKSRAKAGRVPPSAYHVVNLARRHHYRDRDPDAESTGRRLPLHFRRGHWRHYNIDRDDAAAACHHAWRTPEEGDHWRIRIAARAAAEGRKVPGLHCCTTCRAYRLWIEWTLVGNPDVGTIEKHYRV